MKNHQQQNTEIETSIRDFISHYAIKNYLFGSRLYGTSRENSDSDFITILSSDSYPSCGTTFEDDFNKITLHLYTQDHFNEALKRHEVPIIEIAYIHNEIPDWFELDLGKLRESFSQVFNHSWVKGKKKLTVHFDYNKHLAIKSIFHAIRIADYGIQIAKENKISSKGRYNYVYDELEKLASQYERDELWNKIESRYLKLFKDLQHEFKTLAPKELTKHHKEKQKIVDVLNFHNVKHSKKLVQDLHNLMQ